jgi:hypothetical protein
MEDVRAASTTSISPQQENASQSVHQVNIKWEQVRQDENAKNVPVRRVAAALTVVLHVQMVRLVFESQTTAPTIRHIAARSNVKPARTALMV